MCAEGQSTIHISPVVYDSDVSLVSDSPQLHYLHIPYTVGGYSILGL